MLQDKFDLTINFDLISSQLLMVSAQNLVSGRFINFKKVEQILRC